MGAVKSHCPKTRRATGCVFYIASLTLLGISVPIFFESWPHLQIATVLKLCGREAARPPFSIALADPHFGTLSSSVRSRVVLVHPPARSYKDEFEKFDGKCSVNFVERCYKTSPDAQDPTVMKANRDPAGSPHCWQSYTARFNPPQGTRDQHAIYTEYPEFVLVGPGACPLEGAGAANTCDIEDVKKVPSGKLESGKKYDCWRPSGTRYDVRYQCGNSPCYKLADPATIVEPAIAEATRMITLASVLAAVGLAIGCLSLCVWPMSGVTGAQSGEVTREVHAPPQEAISKERRPWAEPPRRSELKAPLSPKKKGSATRGSDDHV